MEIKGTLKKVLPEILRGEFKSRKIWITLAENPEYPQTIEIEVNGKSIDIFNGVAIGAPITCHVNLRGREWVNPDQVKNPTGAAVVFNTIQCWKVEATGTAPATDRLQEHVPGVPAIEDLPF